MKIGIKEELERNLQKQFQLEAKKLVRCLK